MILPREEFSGLLQNTSVYSSTATASRPVGTEACILQGCSSPTAVPSAIGNHTEQNSHVANMEQDSVKIASLSQAVLDSERNANNLLDLVQYLQVGDS